MEPYRPDNDENELGNNDNSATQKCDSKSDKNIEKKSIQKPNKSEEKEANICNECGQLIQGNKCYHCGAYQKFSWVQFFNQLSSATAFLLVIVSIISLVQTCQKRYDAKEARIAAEKALADTQKARSAVETAKKEAIVEARNLINRVKTETATEIKEISNELKKSKNSLNNLRSGIEDEKATLNSIATKSDSALKELKHLNSQINYNDIINRALNDDRKAFDQLQALSLDESYPFNNEAKEQYLSIRDDFSYIRAIADYTRISTDKMPTILMINGNESFEELINKYKNYKTRIFKPVFIDYITDRRNDFPLKDRMSFLVDVLKNDDSLLAAKIANFKILSFIGQNQKLLFDVERTIELWKKNKDKYN